MPLYEYECNACLQTFERIQRVGDTPVSVCPSCGGEVRRLLGVPALQFKGSGWYVTDYGKGNGGNSREKEHVDTKKDSSKDASTSSSKSSSSTSEKKAKPAKAS
ncbi:MAG: zinc ribbon domain-containing protein [bacterium]|nr:zinc ribbon domain-containing protein [bacterium]